MSDFYFCIRFVAWIRCRAERCQDIIDSALCMPLAFYELMDGRLRSHPQHFVRNIMLASVPG